MLMFIDSQLLLGSNFPQDEGSLCTGTTAGIG